MRISQLLSSSVSCVISHVWSRIDLGYTEKQGDIEQLEIASGRVTQFYTEHQVDSEWQSDSLYYTKIRLTTHFSVLWKGIPRLKSVYTQDLHIPEASLGSVCTYIYIPAYIHI